MLAQSADRSAWASKRSIRAAGTASLTRSCSFHQQQQRGLSVVKIELTKQQAKIVLIALNVVAADCENDALRMPDAAAWFLAAAKQHRETAEVIEHA